jgi:hypothetical protein
VATPGDTWKPDPIHDARCVGDGEVAVGARQFKAVQVGFPAADPDRTFELFLLRFAPGVGEIKRVVDGRVVRTLKSFTPGKAKD